MANTKKAPIYLIPPRSHTDDRVTTSIRLPKRMLLHARQHMDLTRSIEHFIRMTLSEIGVDVTKAHDSEIWSEADPNAPQGKPITWGEARAAGLVTEEDKPAPGGTQEETLQ